MPQIYIDTDSANWGIDDGNLVVIEATDEEVEELLENMTDSDICAFGKAKNAEQNGVPPASPRPAVTLCPKCRTAFTGEIRDHPCV